MRPHLSQYVDYHSRRKTLANIQKRIRSQEQPKKPNRICGNCGKTIPDGATTISYDNKIFTNDCYQKYWEQKHATLMPATVYVQPGRQAAIKSK